MSSLPITNPPSPRTFFGARIVTDRLPAQLNKMRRYRDLSRSYFFNPVFNYAFLMYMIVFGFHSFNGLMRISTGYRYDLITAGLHFSYRYGKIYEYMNLFCFVGMFLLFTWIGKAIVNLLQTASLSLPVTFMRSWTRTIVMVGIFGILREKTMESIQSKESVPRYGILVWICLLHGMAVLDVGIGNGDTETKLLVESCMTFFGGYLYHHHFEFHTFEEDYTITVMSITVIIALLVYLLETVERAIAVAEAKLANRALTMAAQSRRSAEVLSLQIANLAKND